MPKTIGMDHLGLSVRDLDTTTTFFVDVLEWEEIARDDSYPRSTVTDGVLRLTLWQVDQETDVAEFDRRSNIGMHHLALEVENEDVLNALAERIAAHDVAQIEFMPELMGTGPRKHMMFSEPGGIRLELLWNGK